MFHDYNPHETRAEFLERAERSRREYDRLTHQEREARRKRVKASRTRAKWRDRRVHRG